MKEADDAPVYLVLAINVEKPDIYVRYRLAAGDALAGFDYEMLSVDDKPTMYEGEQPADHLAIMRFASGAAYDRFYKSDAYSRIAKPLREQSSTTRFITTMKAFTAADRDEGTPA